VALPHEWRHQSLPSLRLPYFPRPPEERTVIRNKVYTLARQAPGEAITELELLDYDFYLFTDRTTGQDSVLYRAATGYRLAQAGARRSGPVKAVTVSGLPVPRLTRAEATVRLEALGQPFLFFVSRETRRGNLIYHRYDGHYGVITPAGK
jgi:Sigma 54 modulation/S30EA ribosomal protein C terminus